MLDLYLHIYYISFPSKLLGFFFSFFFFFLFSFFYVHWVVKGLNFVLLTSVLLVILFWVLAACRRIIFARWPSGFYLQTFWPSSFSPNLCTPDKELSSLCLFLLPACCSEHSHVDVPPEFHSCLTKFRGWNGPLSLSAHPLSIPVCKPHSLSCFNLNFRE